MLGNSKLLSIAVSVSVVVSGLTTVADVPTVTLISQPMIVMASSEFSHDYAVANLFNADITPADIGTANDLAGQWACNCNAETSPVVLMDYDSSVRAGAFLYAQRGGDPAHDKVSEIKLWFYEADPGTGVTVPKAAPEEDIIVTHTSDDTITKYNLSHPRQGRFVVVQFIGKEGNPGGELFQLVAP